MRGPGERGGLSPAEKGSAKKTVKKKEPPTPAHRGGAGYGKHLPAKGRD